MHFGGASTVATQYDAAQISFVENNVKLKKNKQKNIKTTQFLAAAMQNQTFLLLMFTSPRSSSSAFLLELVQPKL